MIFMKFRHAGITAFFVTLATIAWSGVCFGQSVCDPSSSGSVYTRWKAVGQFAADMSLEMIHTAFSVYLFSPRAVQRDPVFSRRDIMPSMSWVSQ